MWLQQMRVWCGVKQWKSVLDVPQFQWNIPKRCDRAVLGDLLGILLFIFTFFFSPANPKAAGMHPPGGSGIKKIVITLILLIAEPK